MFFNFAMWLLKLRYKYVLLAVNTDKQTLAEVSGQYTLAEGASMITTVTQLTEPMHTNISNELDVIAVEMGVGE